MVDSQCALVRNSVASAPEARLMAKKRQKSVRGLTRGNIPLMVSLNAKLNACVWEVPASAHAHQCQQCRLAVSISKVECMQTTLLPGHRMNTSLHHAFKIFCNWLEVG